VSEIVLTGSAWYAKAIASKHSPAAQLAMVDLSNADERQGRIDEAGDLTARPQTTHRVRVPA
jgi:hypothetical protein